MKTLGYAVVGTGYFGAELGRIIQRMDGARVVAVLDPENGETIAKELGCQVETDLEQLCAPSRCGRGGGGHAQLSPQRARAVRRPARQERVL